MQHWLIVCFWIPLLDADLCGPKYQMQVYYLLVYTFWAIHDDWCDPQVPTCLQSTERVPAARLPYRVTLSAGKRYAWCACGHSQKQVRIVSDGSLSTTCLLWLWLRFPALKVSPAIVWKRWTLEWSYYMCVSLSFFQPFCDGAHKSKAPSISPLRFTPETSKTVMLCACKETRNPPYCDGTHFQVIFQDVKKSVKGIFKS